MRDLLKGAAGAAVLIILAAIFFDSGPASNSVPPPMPASTSIVLLNTYGCVDEKDVAAMLDITQRYGPMGYSQALQMAIKNGACVTFNKGDTLSVTGYNANGHSRGHRKRSDKLYWLDTSDLSPPEPDQGSNSAQADDSTHTLKPEMIIHFAKSTLACLSKDDLQEAIEHGIKGENTKLQAMMVQNGGTCAMISPTQSAKIISVEYNDPNMPDMGLVEVVGKGIIAAHGAWALSIGAEPYRAARNHQ